MALIHSKKRDRTSLSPSSIGDASPLATTTATNQQEEYERAVSFLREFHSRQATQLSSPTSHHLDAILETTPDGRSFEDVLSLDFTLALSMGSKGSDSSSSLSSSSHSVTSFSSPNQPSSLVSSSTSSSSSPHLNRSSKRMKKTHTCACLQDLVSDEDSSSSSFSSSEDESILPIFPTLSKSDTSCPPSSSMPPTECYFALDDSSSPYNIMSHDEDQIILKQRDRYRPLRAFENK